MILIGFGRMPNDPPGGNAWLEVWRDRQADLEPLEVVKLGWQKTVKDIPALAIGWLERRPDLIDAEHRVAGQNERALGRTF